jgi:hypothetical protein
MSDIICVVESWDSILDYWKPNCSSSSWYVKELGQLMTPFPLFTGTVLNWFSNQHNKELITPTFPKVRYVKYDELSNTQRYLYLIPVHDGAFFQKNDKVGFSVIPLKILDDIRLKKAAMVFYFPYEGFSGCEHATNQTDLLLIQKWCETANIAPESIYFIHGNLKIEQIKEKQNVRINTIPISLFELWNNIFTIQKEIPNYVGDKIFLCYNRAPRLHRAIFCCELIKNDLLDKGIVSFNTNKQWTPELWRPYIPQYDVTLMDAYNKLREYGSIYTDIETTDNLAMNVNFSHYENTFISVVSETLVCDDILFLSEKIWKPIIVGHPFIVIGNPGTLKYLKSLGFQTFDKWIDESYDDIIDIKKRYSIILNELNKFSNMSKSQLLDIRNEMREVCFHNKNHMVKFVREKYPSLNSNEYVTTHVLTPIWNKLYE